ncbi:MAG TPA: hypothetical protein VE961_09925, partial [Pyrinomonadaceae bacterium]|nr:hypothetical protein [Pyrinomonadaceae bacterium]
NGEIEQVANHMAQAVLSLVRDEAPASDIARLWLTEPLKGPKRYDAVIFSAVWANMFTARSPDRLATWAFHLDERSEAGSTMARFPGPSRRRASASARR